MNRIAARTFLPALAALACLCLLALCLAGCNVNPDKNPAIVDLRTRVKALEDAQKKTADSIKGINIDVTTLDETVRNLKTEVAGMGGNPQQVDAVTKRIEALEQQVQALQGKAAATAKPAADAATPKKPEAAKPEPASKTSGASSGKSSGAAKTPAAPKSGASSAKPSSGAGAEAASSGSAKTTGKYYTIQSGDTLQSLAQQHGTSAAKIGQANSLPADASLMPGQQIFIPNP